MNDAHLENLSESELLAALKRACREGDRVQAAVVRLLIAVEERRTYLKQAYPSLFEYCRTALRMSEGEAFRRINAARLVKRFPQILARLERGDVHLSALVQLRDHFTDENVDDLIDATTGKNKMQIAELVARIAPRPDAPTKLRKIPHHDKSSRVTNESKPAIEPLSEARYRLQLTGSREFRDKLLRLRDLMMHMNPYGDLGVVVERAVDELLAKLEKNRFGKTVVDRRAAEASAAPASGKPSESGNGPKDARGPARRPGLVRTNRGHRAAGAFAKGPSGTRAFSSASKRNVPARNRAARSKPLPTTRSG